MINPPAVLTAPLSAQNFHLMGVPFTILEPRVADFRGQLLLIQFNETYSADQLPDGFIISVKAALIVLKDLEERGIIRALRPYHIEHVGEIYQELLELKPTLLEVQQLLTFHIHVTIGMKSKLNDPGDITYNRQPNSISHNESLELCDDLINILVDTRFLTTETIGTINFLVFGVPVAAIFDEDGFDSGIESGEDEDDEEGSHNSSFQDEGIAGALVPVEQVNNGGLVPVEQPAPELIVPLQQFNFQELFLNQITELCILPRPSV